VVSLSGIDLIVENGGRCKKGNMLNLKNASLFGLIFATIAMVALVFRESLFAVGPVSITIQVLAALLMLWARVTFGARSFHPSANTTSGGSMTSGPYKFLRRPIYVQCYTLPGREFQHTIWQ